ncbi:uncharacterized protein LOC124670407 [Lolium rigidum]|uniref:uncharacterized protein LOC124670281 n=1 Tax=Lolium rigidum TaxID=89674 RepID=UPI001F5C2AF5|nr:uncharacterized protein LOC124670281 [Lolium rigidum]XP_047062870.1 uncharacterized protein LOC124670407 [Lolium rigidum]
MKQKIVIQVSVSSDKSRRKVMTTAAKTTGVISVGITGDSRDMLEVVGNDVDTVSLVGRLRKKLLGRLLLGRLRRRLLGARIVKVEEFKDKKKKEEDEKLPYWYPGYYYHHQYPSHMVVADQPSSCAIM